VLTQNKILTTLDTTTEEELDCYKHELL